MFSNEVLVEKFDKDRLIELLEEVDDILGKYPYETYDGSHTVTNISRAKTFSKDALQWCRHLYTKG